MRKKIEETERLGGTPLDKFIHSFKSYNSDSKALVLRLVAQVGDISQVATLTGLSERTIYGWIEAWIGSPMR